MALYEEIIVVCSVFGIKITGQFKIVEDETVKGWRAKGEMGKNTYDINFPDCALYCYQHGKNS